MHTLLLVMFVQVVFQLVPMQHGEYSQHLTCRALPCPVFVGPLLMSLEPLVMAHVAVMRVPAVFKHLAVLLTHTAILILLHRYNVPCPAATNRC